MTSKRGSATPSQQQFHQAITRGADAWYGVCLRITRDESLAQDAVQDALLQAWRKRRQFHGTSALETWIHRIAINSALAILRKHRAVTWVDLTDEHGSAPATAEDEAATHDVDHLLHQALIELSELERICFVLKHLEEWRLQEIAAQLEIGIGSVKQALFRGLHKLRHSMANLKGES